MVALGQENRPKTVQLLTTTVGAKKGSKEWSKARLSVEPPSSKTRPTCFQCGHEITAARGYVDYTLQIGDEDAQLHSKLLRPGIFDTVALCKCTGYHARIENMPPGTNGPAGGAGLAIRPRNRHGSLTVEAGAADAISGETLANLPYMVRLMVNELCPRARSGGAMHCNHALR